MTETSQSAETVDLILNCPKGKSYWMGKQYRVQRQEFPSGEIRFEMADIERELLYTSVPRFLFELIYGPILPDLQNLFDAWGLESND